MCTNAGNLLLSDNDQRCVGAMLCLAQTGAEIEVDLDNLEDLVDKAEEE